MCFVRIHQILIALYCNLPLIFSSSIVTRAALVSEAASQVGWGRGRDRASGDLGRPPVQQLGALLSLWASALATRKTGWL